MPSKAQLETALINADKAGDTEAAKSLATALKNGQYDQEASTSTASSVSAAPQPASPAAPASNAPREISPTYLQRVGQNLGNEIAGLARGAGSIGATLVTPYDLAMGNTESIGNPERRQSIDTALTGLGAQPGSGLYKAGKLVGEVAGTAGVGSALAGTAAAAGAPAGLVSALNSGGFSVGSPAANAAFGKGLEWLTRIGAGAAVGGASAGLVDPTQAKEGAIIGGALPVATKVAGTAGKLIKDSASWFATHSIGALTGTSPETVSMAFQSGKEGLTSFLDNMRGKVDFGDVVDAAKQGLANMRDARAQAYRSGMVNIKNDKTVLDFAGVDKALNDVVSTGSFKGVPIRQKAAETVDDLKNIVEQWRNLDPAQYHTPEGFDALKQAVGDIRDSTQFGTPARRAADAVYNAVKTEINQQAPAYASVMKDYQTASNTIKEIEKTLSLGDKASQDTAIRKLQSLLRNNVNTSYGNRANLIKTLEEQGGKELKSAIAGQSMNTSLPRGMTGALEKAVVAPGAAIGVSSGILSPYTLAVAPLTSPRIVGEGAYGLGRLVGGIDRAGGVLFNPLLNGSPAQIESANALLRTAPLINLSARLNQQ